MRVLNRCSAVRDPIIPFKEVTFDECNNGMIAASFYDFGGFNICFQDRHGVNSNTQFTLQIEVSSTLMQYGYESVLIKVVIVGNVN